MGTFGLSEKWGGYACNRASRLGNGITGACFQAPHATPGQRPMETYLAESLKQWLLSTIHSKIVQHAFTDVLDGLGIGMLEVSYNILLKWVLDPTILTFHHYSN